MHKLNRGQVMHVLSIASSPVWMLMAALQAQGNEADAWRTKHPEWIWCDDFEADHSASYFEYDPAGGHFTRVPGVGINGSMGMKAVFTEGMVSAGSLKLACGKTPSAYFRPVDAGTAVYRELYWRFYFRNQPGWTGGGGAKLSRALVMSSSAWAEAAFAHLWSGGGQDEHLLLDPASGTDAAGIVVTTKYNDFPHMRWLGSVASATPIYDSAHVGTWRCIEAHMRLNDAGAANGVLELWIDGVLEARKADVNWVGSYNEFGINCVFLENYWNKGSPKQQERYFDNFVVSTKSIGPCLDIVNAKPNDPSGQGPPVRAP
jgi:hypothetical protein